MTDIVEAMARGIIAAGCPVGIAHDLARAAIRAARDAGGLVVERMPGKRQASMVHYTVGEVAGYNAALAAVRAAAVEVEE